jgi:hypothetical protein
VGHKRLIVLICFFASSVGIFCSVVAFFAFKPIRMTVDIMTASPANFTIVTTRRDGDPEMLS